MNKFLFLILLIFANVHSEAQILVAQYNFDGNALDAVGNHHGTLTNGPTYTTDRFGNPNSAIFLDGIDDFIILADAITLQANTYTYDLWVNPSSNPGAAQAKCILSIGGNGGDQLMTNAGVDGWNLSGYQNPSGTYNTTSNVPPVIGQWYHVTGTRDLTTATLYVNGVPVDVATFSNGTSPKYGQSNAYIGRRTNNGFVGPQYFHGAIDDLKIYSGINIPLPLDITLFKGEQDNNQTILNWHTANMKNVLGFEIEKSNNGILFEKIGYTEATEKNEYTFTDPQLSDRNNFYRLKIMDEDGQFTYSKTVLVINTEKTEMVCFPNPIHEELNISSSAYPFTYHLYDLYGNEMLTGVSANQQIRVSCTSLSKGMYMIKVVSNGEIKTLKFTKE
ncbi:MAG: T9SS type A sorting domain-containing protein [Bacteroidetes bacterium]|nr:T9SS type A sorting domain-containing protein [Bacteroidota bacterium]